MGGIVHPHDVKILTDSLNATIDQKQSFKVILRLMRTADKTYRWHICSCYPYKNELGNILRWYFFSAEIHEEKVAHENHEKLNYRGKAFYRDQVLIGIGIEEKQYEKVFKIFKKVKVNTGGAGVGLYIAKRIIENLGGEIILESKLGEGSTFTICFPLDNPVSC